MYIKYIKNVSSKRDVGSSRPTERPGGSKYGACLGPKKTTRKLQDSQLATSYAAMAVTACVLCRNLQKCFQRSRDLQIFAAFFRKFRVSNQCSFLIRSPWRKLKTEYLLTPRFRCVSPHALNQLSMIWLDSPCGSDHAEMIKENLKNSSLLHHQPLDLSTICQNPNLRCLN